MAVSDRGVLPVALTGTEAYAGPAVSRIPLQRNGQPILQTLCAFRRLENRSSALLAFEESLAAQFQSDE